VPAREPFIFLFTGDEFLRRSKIESLLDFEQLTITRNGHTSFVKPFPISIAFPNPSKEKSANFDTRKFLKSLNIKTKYIGVGVDRLDYTKGILERLKAIEIFLKRYPAYVGNFTFIQIAAPSRIKIKEYQKFTEAVEKEVERVNNLFRKNGWRPIILFKKKIQKQCDAVFAPAVFCLFVSDNAEIFINKIFSYILCFPVFDNQLWIFLPVEFA